MAGLTKCLVYSLARANKLAMHCLYCHSDDHPWFNCRKRPDGWKPPKKSTEPVAQLVERPLSGRVAGSRPAGESVSLDTRLNEGAREVPSLSVDAKPGRPRDEGPSKGTTKRAAAMREYMRGYRDRKGKK